MTAALRRTAFILLFAAIIWRTETQWVTDSNAEEEEEKKLNVVFGNGSSRSTLSPEISVPSNASSVKDTDKLLSWKMNLTDYEELHEEEHRNDASPENNVDRELLNKIIPPFDETPEVEPEIVTSKDSESSTNSDLDFNNETVPDSISTVTQDALLTKTNLNCTVGNIDCSASQPVAIEELSSSNITYKISHSTYSVVSASPTPLWNIVKPLKSPPQLNEEVSDSSTTIKILPTSPYITLTTSETSTAQTSENLIIVEGSVVGKDDSVIQNFTNKSEKSKQVKQGESFADFSDEVQPSTTVKFVETTPMTEFMKETSAAEVNSSTSALLINFSEITSPHFVPSLVHEEFDNPTTLTTLSSDVIYPPTKLDNFDKETSTVGMPFITQQYSKIPQEFYSSYPSSFSTVMWNRLKSSFPQDEKVTKSYTDKASGITPILLPSFRETTSVESDATESLTSSFTQEFADLSSSSTKNFQSIPFTPTLEPQLNSRFIVQDTTTSFTTQEEHAPPPRLTNPGCSSLPICVEVTLLETTWEQFCPQAHEFQEFLSKVVSHYTRPIHSHQIILDAEHCLQNPSVHQLQNSPDVSIAFYVTDDSGEYEERLTEICGVILRKWAPTSFRNSVMEIRLFNEAISTPIPIIPEINSGFVAAVSISAVAGVALCLLCILLVIMKQKLLHGRNSETTSPTADAYSLDSLSINASFRRRRTRRSARSYLNHAFSDQEFPSHPLNEKSLQNCLKNRDLLEEEFKKIPMNMPKLDQIPEGAHVKNRYSNILPKPESRVVLAEPSGDPLKCYINANYVKGYEGKASFYIACQAPLPEGIEDFWRMIWEQQCRVIVMLTMFEENGVSRCAVYFPQSTLVAHPPSGDFQVSLLKKEVYEFYTMSTLRLLDLEKNLFRDVVHLWYTSWPDVGVPKDPSSLVTFVQQCRPFINCNSGPTIVHCSTGTGRTGVFLALDICMREYDESRSIDILQCVSQLRRDRGGAVQNKDQYVLIYEALLEYVARVANQSQRPSIRSTNS